MRTARTLTISPSTVCSGGGVSALGGCTWSQGGVSALGVVPDPRGVCVCSGGCTWSWGVCLGGGCTGWVVVYLVLGVVYLVRHSPTPPPLWTEWHMLLKILPCPKLHLRAVISFSTLCNVCIFQLHSTGFPLFYPVKFPDFSLNFPWFPMIFS